MTRWALGKLGEFVDILSGFAFDSASFGNCGDIPIVRIRDVVPGFSSTLYRGDYDPRFVIRNGDMLIGMDGEFNRARWQGGKALLNQRVCRIASSSCNLDDAYLFHFLPAALRAIEAVTPYVTVRHLSVNAIRQIGIPLPPVGEQRRIADVLDRAETLQAKRRAALAQLDTLTQSVFLDLFGDPATNSNNLNIGALGNCLTFVTSGGRGWAEFYVSKGSRFIRSLDVQMNHIGSEDIAFVTPPDNAEARRTRVAAGDVVLTITGSRIGRVASVPADLAGAYVSQHVAILRPDPTCIEPEFLSFFLSLEAGGQRQIARAQYGQTKPGLNFEQIRRFQIPLPPVRLQQDFARRIAAIETLKSSHRASLAQLDALFASLQHRAFRGEL